MLHRQLEGGVLLISQPGHAWVSGQLAAAWGNAEFGSVAPRADVCMAAEQHDIGWLDWEASPTLNPASGLPRTFMELPTNEHIAVWAPAGPRALVYGPYVALLVSMHGTGLYQRHDFSRDSFEEAEAARRFMKDGAQFEASLLAAMTDVPSFAPFIAPDIVARNRRLVAVWDAMSLLLCGGITDARDFSNVPAAGEPTAIRFERLAGDRERLSVNPWPFNAVSVNLACAGRWIDSTFTDQDAMQAAINHAHWRRLEFELVPHNE